jgi:hypothetical protein
MVSSILETAGGIFGANEQVKGQKVAQDMFTMQKQQYDPLVSGGLEGFDQLEQAILGDSMEGYENFMQNPNIQYQIQQGLEGATQGLAGRGMLNSGRGMMELQGVGQNIAGQRYQQYLNNLGGLADYSMQGLGRQDLLTGEMAGSRIGAGQARAGRSQAIGSALSDVEDSSMRKAGNVMQLAGRF